jgi:hypothetical protein
VVYIGGGPSCLAVPRCYLTGDAWTLRELGRRRPEWWKTEPTGRMVTSWEETGAGSRHLDRSRPRQARRHHENVQLLAPVLVTADEEERDGPEPESGAPGAPSLEAPDGGCTRVLHTLKSGSVASNTSWWPRLHPSGI